MAEYIDCIEIDGTEYELRDSSVADRVGISVEVNGTTLKFLTKDNADYAVYSGAYEVQSTIGGGNVTLNTEGKVLAKNITATEIPVSEVSNVAGGKTLTIGG